MKKNAKKLISLLMVVMMLVSHIPSSALAAEDTATPVAVQEDQDTDDTVLAPETVADPVPEVTEETETNTASDVITESGNGDAANVDENTDNDEDKNDNVGQTDDTATVSDTPENTEGNTSEPEQADKEEAVEEPAEQDQADKEEPAEKPAKEKKADKKKAAEKSSEQDDEDVALDELADDDETEPTGPAKSPQPPTTINGREVSSLNTFGTSGNMRTTLTHVDGSPITEPLNYGDEFKLTLEFWETPDGIQFDMDTLIYNLPSGITCLATHTGESEVSLLTAEGDLLTLTTTFVVDKTTTPNRIIYEWNHAEDDPNNTYERLALAENVRLTISTVMMVGDDPNGFRFEDGEELPVDLSVDITVIKENSINGSYVLTPDDKEQMVFAIFDADGNRAKDADDNEIPTFTYADMVDQGNNQAKKVFTGLVAGTYTVKEISTLSIPDYTFSSQSVTELSIEIPPSDERTFHLKNIYVQDSGTLILKKNFAEGSALNAGMTKAQREKITYHVTGPGFDHIYTYDEIYTAGGELTLNDLAVGNYSVFEESNIPGYECTSAIFTFTVDGEARGTGNNGGSIAVEHNKESEALFTNNYRQKTGSLKLEKLFDGNALTDALKSNVSFTITGPNNYSRTVTYAEIASGSITITDLPIGTYTIQENGVANGNGVSVQTLINGTVDTDRKTTVTITDGVTSQTTYKNIYTKVGSLKINKSITCDNDYVTFARFRSKTPKPYIIVTGPNYNSGKIYFNASGFNSGSYTINNLPIGNYTVTEYDGSYSTNYTFSVTYDGDVSGSGTSTPGTSAVPQGGTGQVTIHNDYTRNKGKINIKKALSGDITSVADFKSKFTDPDTVLFTISNGTYSFNVKVSDLDENGEFTQEVPTGSAAYTITEINADLEHYIRNTTVTLDGSASSNPTSALVDEKGEEHTAVFNNNYVNSGKLKITKSYVGALNAAQQAEVSANLRFQILDADNGDAVVSVNGQTEFTLEEMIAGIDLPVGHYKVVESGDEYHPEIYTHGENDVWSMLVSEDNEIDRTYGHTSAAQAVTYGNESYIYFWNRYSLVGVGIGVIKYVIINGQSVNTEGEYDQNQFTAEQIRVENLVKNSIRFYVYEGTSTSGTLKGIYAYRADSITDEEREAGVKPVTQLILTPGTYTIEEKHYEVPNYTASVLFFVSGSIQGGTKESRDHKVTFTVIAGGHIGIDITNGYMGYGNLVVKKEFGASSQLNNENLTEDQKKAIQFTVTGYKNDRIDDDGTPQDNNEIVYGPETFSYFDMTEENGVFQKKFEEIPIGVYIVKETNAAGISNLYNCTTTVEPDANYYAIELGETEQIAFTNTYTRKLGNLEVKKTFAGDPLNSDCDLSKIKFHVYDSEGHELEGSPKTYTELTDGKWTITNLPTGTYTVKEEGADYEENYYERTTTVSVNGVTAPYSDAAGVSGAVDENETLHVELINSYKEVGALVFNKSFIDDEAINKLTEEQKAAVAFTVKDSTGATIKEIYYSDILAAIAAGESGYKLLVDAPADYTIIEDADIDGYERTTTVQVNAQDATYDETTGVSAHVERFTSSTVDFTNEYKEAGKLTVTKRIVYIGDLTEAQQREFKFTVTDPDGNVLKDGEGNEIGIFTYYDMVKDESGKNGTKTFENLPAGTYHIKEEVLHEGDDEANPFYGLVRTTTIAVGTDTTSGLEADFTVTKENPNVIVTNRYDDVPPLTVVKRGGGNPNATVVLEGQEYPIWKFTLDISNLSVATTDNGMTEIKDTYDVLTGASDLGIRPEYFRTLTAAEAAAYASDSDANKLIPVDEGGNADGITVTITENGTDGSTIKIEGVSEQTSPHHTLTFYLIPKDLNSLGLLNLHDELDEAPEGSMEVIKSFNNNIQYKELPLNDWITQKTPVEYNYRYQLLSKNAINYDAERKCFFNPNNPNQIVNYAVYEVVMNEEGKWLGAEDLTMLDCTDEFSTNQYVDESSIEFFRYNGDENDPEAVEVDWTISGHVITFQIENGKRYVMRYRAELLYTSEQLHSTITVWNKFTMAGKWVNPHPEYVPESLGDASEDYIKLRKSDKNKTNIGLAGAVFELYHSVAEAEAGENCIGTYTTGEDGILIIRDWSYEDESGTHSGSIHPGEWALKEITAPPGYELINYIVEVILANRLAGETANTERHIYLPTTTVGVKDTPYATTVEIGALKELIGSNLAVAEGDYEFTLTGLDNAPTGIAASNTSPAPTDPVTVANDAYGKARFGAIQFRTSDLTPIIDADGEITGYEPTTFSYTVKEEPGDKGGITYDTTEHTVEVTVSVNDDEETLDVEVKIDGETVTADDNVYFANISNEYSAEGHLVLGAKKTLEGRKLRVEEFTFEAALNDADGTVVSAMNADENVYECDIVFPQIDYVLAESDEDGYKDTTKVVEVDGKYVVYIDPDVMNKTDSDDHRYVDYQYTISESTANPIQGVTYDGTEYPITVRVTDLDNGELKIKVLKNNAVISETDFFSNFTFVNVYSAEGDATPVGKKFVENDEQALEAGTYKFNVYDITTGEVLLGEVTHEAADAGNLGAAIKFPKIKAVVKPSATDAELGMKVSTNSSGYVGEITITYRNLEDFEGKEFKFKFNELHGGEVRDGVQYSDASYEVTATVTLNTTDESVLDVNLDQTADVFDFINTPMEAEGEATPKGTKVLNGKELKEGDFTFDLYYGTTVIGHVTNEAGGKIKYPTIKFVLDAGGTEGVTVDSETDTTLVTITVRNPGKLAGPYEFTVKENSDNPSPGIVYPLYPDDRKTFTATAKMKSGSNTEIEVTLTNADALNFINTYGAQGEDKPEGKKKLEGRDLKAGEFHFGILDEEGTLIGQVTNDLNGKILYPTFRYVVDSKKTPGRELQTANGSLVTVIITVKKAEDLAPTTYKAYEIEESEAGITYDTTTEQTITVTPSVNPENEAELTVTAEAEADKEFTNTYYAEGKAKPSGYKELTNRLPELGEFKFDILEGDTRIATVENTDDLNDQQNKKKINYPTFKYTVDSSKDAGTTYDEDSNTIIVNVQKAEDIESPYSYKVKEVVPEGADETTDGRYIYKGVTYDLTVIDLTVTVAVNLNDASRLDVTINKSTGNDFKNKYEAKGALDLTAEKTLLGRILNSGEFTFQLKDEQGNVLQEKQNVKNTITFDKIVYTLDNMDRDEHGFVKDTDYIYTVSELKENAGGVTYDTNIYTIKVKLHDLGDGNIQVTVKDEFSNIIEAIFAEYKFYNSFVNYYEAEGKGGFTGSKKLLGREIKADDEETVFTFKIEFEGKEFTLTNTGNEIKYPELKFVVDGYLEPGTVMLPNWEDDSHETIVVRAAELENIIDVVDPEADPVEYLPKDYELKVTEETGNAAGIAYDVTEYTVKATVSLNDTDKAVLDVDIATDPGDPENVNFLNIYRAYGDNTGSGNKFLYGRVLRDKEFVFTIKDEKGNAIGTVVNDATGVVQYPTFIYEVNPEAEAFGMTTETDDQGNLVTVKKTYESKEALEADHTATYTVTEEDLHEPGITYDGATVDTINVSVEVTKEEIAEGVAKLDVTVETDSEAKFTNYYRARGINTISGSKELTYRLPEDEEFEFVISEAPGLIEGREIARVKSSDMINDDYTGKTINYPAFMYVVDYQATPGTVYDAEKNVIIVTVNWVEELEDGFSYIITEVDDGKDYFTYDTTEITLNVTVTPTGEEIEERIEKLDVEIEDSEGNDFHNEYHAKGALQLYAEKTLLGRFLNRDDFTFNLKRTDETFEEVIEELDTKTNTKDGTITFDLIEYDLDSMDQDEHGFVVDTKYYYTVNEVLPEGAVENEDGTYTYNGDTYDTTVFQITATLHDNKKGLIQVSVEATPAGELTFLEEMFGYEFKFGNAFVNFYHAEGENTISGNKTLRGRVLTDGEYQFEIKDADGNVLATVSNNADGTINYPVFRYVVNHLAGGTSYAYDPTNNTLTLTTATLEDMVTAVMQTEVPEPPMVEQDAESEAPAEDVIQYMTYESKDYTYTISEVIPEGATDNGDGTWTYKGVTYNELDSLYTLTVTVNVNKDDMGILDVSIDNAEGLDFSNCYRAEGEDTVVGIKILKGADIKDYEGKFNFTVSDSEGNLITTVSNDAEGNILYPTFRFVVDPDAEAGAEYDEEANVYTVTVNAYEDLEESYSFKVTELEGDIEDMAYNVGEKLEYEITVTVVANDEDQSILDVVAIPNTSVDFVNRQYFKAGLFKVSENSGEALKGAVIQLVRVEDGAVIDKWTSDGTIHMINLIEIGTGTFRFVEVQSPSGYHLAKSIEFTMSEDGEFFTTYAYTFDTNGNAIFVMKDPKIPNTKTGDDTPLGAVGGTFALGLAGIAAVLVQKKRRRRI